MAEIESKRKNYSFLNTTLLATALGLFSLLFSGRLASSADFEHDPSPLDMRKFWPSRPRIDTFRRSDGRLYIIRQISLGWEKRMSRYIPDLQNEEEAFSRVEFMPTGNALPGGDPKNDPVAFYNNSWSIKTSPDWSVFGVADLFPANPDCLTPCGMVGQFYPDKKIALGRPGGHKLGEDYYRVMDVKMDSTFNIDNTSPQPSDWKLYTITKVSRKYNSYSAEYGRSEGIWGPGRGRTYSNVIETVFQHGTNSPEYPTGKVCPNLPSSLTHQDGYTSFWQYIYYAENDGRLINTGLFKEVLLFDEQTCEGALSPNGKPKEYYWDYLD